VHGDAAYGPFVLAGLVAGSVLTFAYTARLLLGAFRPGFAFEGFGSTEPRIATDVPTVVDPPCAEAALLGLVDPVGGGHGGARASCPTSHPTWCMARPERSTRASSPTTSRSGTGSTWRSASRRSPSPSGCCSWRSVGWWARSSTGCKLPSTATTSTPACSTASTARAKGLTAVVQNGSLPVYIGIIVLTVVLLPGEALLAAPRPEGLALASGPGDWVVAVLIIVAGAAAAVLRSRMAAVLCLGAVGYGMALVFVLQGAPDLALTQFSIETLGAILFVLVLRKLPGAFEERPTRLGLALRVGVSALVGLVVFAFALVATGVRTAPSLAPEIIARSVPEGEGYNVVNVILVDFRGLDTLGEVTVLLVAALGVISLTRLRAGRVPAGDSADRAADVPAPTDDPLVTQGVER
jgi:multicomponent Na+:H+ antiporter subunit A